METLRGETVAHLVRRRARRLSACELGHLGVHLCSAVSYLHREGVLHLDLKPSNVIAEGRPREDHRPVARAPARHGRARRRDLVLHGARAGPRGEIGPAADVFGIAGILYECATGVAPFGGEDDEDVEFPSLVRAAHPVARERRLPAALAAAIDGGMAAQPAARLSVEQLGAACELRPGWRRRSGASAR